MADEQGNGLTVLLGKGDGTFDPGVTLSPGNGPTGVVSFDLNGDGKPDLIAANSQDDTVVVLLGHGDGTFAGPSPFDTGNAPAALVVRDFNRDGKPDVATADNSDNTVSLLFGNGDGTLQAAIPFPVANGPAALAAGDFNRDGIVDVVAPARAGNTASVLINQEVTLTLITGPASSTYGQQATFTATVTVGGVAATGGTVTFFDGANAISGPLPLDANSQAIFSTSALKGGSHTIGATYSGTGFNFNSPGLAPSSFSIPFTVNPAPLTVTAADSSRVYGAANPEFTVRYDGFVRGEGPGVLQGRLTFADAGGRRQPRRQLLRHAGGAHLARLRHQRHRRAVVGRAGDADREGRRRKPCLWSVRPDLHGLVFGLRPRADARDERRDRLPEPHHHGDRHEPAGELPDRRGGRDLAGGELHVRVRGRRAARHDRPARRRPGLRLRDGRCPLLGRGGDLPQRRPVRRRRGACRPDRLGGRLHVRRGRGRRRLGRLCRRRAPTPTPRAGPIR